MSQAPYLQPGDRVMVIDHPSPKLRNRPGIALAVSNALSPVPGLCVNVKLFHAVSSPYVDEHGCVLVRLDEVVVPCTS